MEEKIRSALLRLREGKDVNPTLLAGMLEWALLRAEDAAKAEHKFEVSSKKCLELMEKFKEAGQEEERPEPKLSSVDVYVAHLEGALLALDKKHVIEAARGDPA